MAKIHVSQKAKIIIRVFANESTTPIHNNRANEMGEYVLLFEIICLLATHTHTHIALKTHCISRLCQKLQRNAIFSLYLSLTLVPCELAFIRKNAEIWPDWFGYDAGCEMMKNVITLYFYVCATRFTFMPTPFILN